MRFDLSSIAAVLILTGVSHAIPVPPAKLRLGSDDDWNLGYYGGVRSNGGQYLYYNTYTRSEAKRQREQEMKASKSTAGGSKLADAALSVLLCDLEDAAC